MKKIYYFHIVDLNLKTSYQIASLFDRYIDMDERLPWNQDCDHCTSPQGGMPHTNSMQCTFCHIVTTYDKLVVNYFSVLYICLNLESVNSLIPHKSDV